MAKADSRIQTLHFGVLMPTWNSDNVVTEVDLFDLGHIRYYAAKYRMALHKETIDFELGGSDPLAYIFGDVWSRSEFEFVIRTLGGRAERKTDLFDLYVRPNRIRLLGMVEGCTMNSAKQYLRDYRKKHPTK